MSRPNNSYRAFLLSAAVLAAAVPFALAQQAPPAPAGGQPGAQPAAPGAPGGARGRGGFGGGGGGGAGRGRGAGAVEIPRPNPLPAFYDTALTLDQRVDNLMSQLTIEEKIAQTQMAAPAIPRLGIYAYDWWSEALHGIANSGTATVFPQAIGMGASWDPALHLQMATVISTEARAKYAAYSAAFDHARFHGIDLWSPNINIFRDPRWGRGQETYGEDPYLTGRMAISFVKGIQGDDPFYFRAIATPKHFAVHSGPEPLRHRFDAVITDEDLYTTYLPAFEAAVREGHAYSIMSSYNALDGVPNSGNKRLLTDILRGQWGFNGYVVSDVDSVGDIFQRGSHNYVPAGMNAQPSAALASALAIKAGNDLNSGTTYAALPQALQDGYITEKEIDVTLRRLLTARFRLGEFDPVGSPGYAKNPYNKITAAELDTEPHNAIAHKEADESMVLLKNANHTLPLKKNLGTIAVLGPNANAATMQNGNYNGTPSRANGITILEGIQVALASAHPDEAVTDAEMVQARTTWQGKSPQLQHLLAVGAHHVQYLQGPPLVTDRVALAEPVNAEFFFTDKSKTKGGLTAAYAATVEGLATPTRTEVTKNATLAADAAPAAGEMAVRWTGVLAPPSTGDYQLGARANGGFRITINGKVILDEMTGGGGGGGGGGRGGPGGGGGGARVLGNSVHLEKDKTYNVTIDFARTPAGGGRGGRGAGGGAPGGGGFGPGRGPGAALPGSDGLVFTAAPGAPAAPAAGGAAPGIDANGVAIVPGDAPAGRGRGGRGGRGGGPPFGSTAAAPGVTATQPADGGIPLFEVVWTRPTADGAPANTTGGNLYAEEIELAKKADAIVVVVGIDATLEREQAGVHNIGFEGGDRTAIELPAVQENLIKQVVKAAGNKPVIVVNCSGSAIALAWENDNVPAILQAWYPGQRGDAVADVLFGDYNPAGRLPVTFYKSTDDLPAFTDYNMYDRTYRYYTGSVLFPFGHGLSYSTFEYTGLTAPKSVQTTDDVKVSVNVKNTSAIDGEEVVECYINRNLPAVDPKLMVDVTKLTDAQATAASTPRKQLVGFMRVPLKAGEQKQVTFTITPQQMSVAGAKGARIVNPESVTLQVGGTSATGVTAPLAVQGTPKAPEYRYVAPVVN